jgi:hypothetical protein
MLELQKRFWTPLDIQNIIDSLWKLHDRYENSNNERLYSILDTIKLYEELFWDLRREIAKYEWEKRYEDYNEIFHDV